MSSRPRILIVEDEDAIRRGLCDLLAYNGLDPVGVADGTLGCERALAEPWDLIVLDVMLPGQDGFSICRAIRAERPGQAVVMLTAKDREEDILKGFEAGCDDYVSKPFSVSQLVARVKALLRRAGVDADRTLSAADVVVHVDALIARGPRGEVPLSVRDVEVLRHLAVRRPAVVKRTDLLAEVWGYQRVEGVETRAIDMHMVKLRRKLLGASDADLVETVRGAGYRMRP
ncbi:MAG: response regulator transcription factor [Myxococcota bacterium]